MGNWSKESEPGDEEHVSSPPEGGRRSRAGFLANARPHAPEPPKGGLPRGLGLPHHPARNRPGNRAGAKAPASRGTKLPQLDNNRPLVQQLTGGSYRNPKGRLPKVGQSAALGSLVSEEEKFPQIPPGGSKHQPQRLLREGNQKPQPSVKLSDVGRRHLPEAEPICPDTTEDGAEKWICEQIFAKSAAEIKVRDRSDPNSHRYREQMTSPAGPETTIDGGDKWAIEDMYAKAKAEVNASARLQTDSPPARQPEAPFKLPGRHPIEGALEREKLIRAGLLDKSASVPMSVVNGWVTDPDSPYYMGSEVYQHRAYKGLGWQPEDQEHLAQEDKPKQQKKEKKDRKGKKAKKPASDGTLPRVSNPSSEKRSRFC